MVRMGKRVVFVPDSNIFVEVKNSTKDIKFAMSYLLSGLKAVFMDKKR